MSNTYLWQLLPSVLNVDINILYHKPQKGDSNPEEPPIVRSPIIPSYRWYLSQPELILDTNGPPSRLISCCPLRFFSTGSIPMVDSSK